MNKCRGFTLIELMVVVVTTAIVISVFWVVGQDKPHHHSSPKMKNSTQLRGIMTEFSMWSDENSQTGEFPGGITAPAGTYPQNAAATTVLDRFWALVAAPGSDPLNPRMLVNPAAGGIDTVWAGSIAIKPGATSAASAQFGVHNVSYALLSTTMGSEWHNNTNPGCPMICDRNRGTNALPSSSWSSSQWQGSVGWGDVHTTFETSPVLSVTLYGNTCPSSNLWDRATSSNAGMLNPGF
jgi:prepilin-type N-terminal cleavage/methylation domain-containing protein